jgi:hypothetical protein
MARRMRDLARALGAELARHGAVERLRQLRSALAAAGLGEPAAHVDCIVARLEAVVDDADDARTLKLAALAHELDPSRVARTLMRAGVDAEAARDAERLVAAFWAADLWRGTDDAGPRAWLRRAGSGARLLLLFEFAHEGGVTAGMTAAADLAGLAADVEAWLARLPPRAD